MSKNPDPLDWWGPCLHGISAVIDCLPIELQTKVVERLRLLAVVQEDRGLDLDSYFSRALSGEPAPPPGKVAQPIALEERVEAKLTRDFDFRDMLQPQGLLSPALKPRKE